MWKRRLVWAIWLAGAALLWLFENNAATLTLLIASVLLPCASMLLARRAAKGAFAALRVPPEAAKGGAFRAELTVRTAKRPLGARFALELLCENRLTCEAARFPLSAAAGKAEILDVSAAHCGTLRLRAVLRAEDLFGLWRSAELPGAEEFVTVAPKLFPLTVAPAEDAAAAAESERYSLTRPGSDPSETFAIREYAPGDPIRQIHWKLSQKTGATMVRELGLPVADRTLLVFRNLLRGEETVAPERADAMAEVFLSLSRALADEGCVHTAAFAEGGRFILTEVQNETDFRAMSARFLTLGWAADDGALARLLAEMPCARVAIVSTEPPDTDAFRRDGSVTVLSASAETGGAGGSLVIPFSTESYDKSLNIIEI